MENNFFSILLGAFHAKFVFRVTYLWRSGRENRTFCCKSAIPWSPCTRIDRTRRVARPWGPVSTRSSGPTAKRESADYNTCILSGNETKKMSRTFHVLGNRDEKSVLAVHFIYYFDIFFVTTKLIGRYGHPATRVSVHYYTIFMISMFSLWFVTHWNNSILLIKVQNFPRQRPLQQAQGTNR